MFLPDLTPHKNIMIKESKARQVPIGHRNVDIEYNIIAWAIDEIKVDLPALESNWLYHPSSLC